MKPKRNSFPIVAIGASLGGLNAMINLLSGLSSKTGMAFIFVQHISPNHKSYLTELLSDKTEMKVQEIQDMDRIIPNSIYIIPPDKAIKVIDGHIKLIPRSNGSRPVSIDILFSSLAETYGKNVVGVILSGNMDDGTEGVMAIKRVGGITFAQESAQAPSMPLSAIASGAVDYVLPAHEIGKKLSELNDGDILKRD